MPETALSPLQYVGIGMVLCFLLYSVGLYAYVHWPHDRSEDARQLARRRMRYEGRDLPAKGSEGR